MSPRFVFALLLLAAPTVAAERLTAGLGLNLSAFGQEGHAPPICCGERDSWIAPGIGFQADVRYAPSTHLRFAGGLRYSFHYRGVASEAGDRLHVAEGLAAIDVMSGNDGNVAYGAGIVGALGVIRGSFPRADHEGSRSLTGLGLRVRAENFHLGAATLAFDLTVVKYAIVHHSVTLGVWMLWPL